MQTIPGLTYIPQYLDPAEEALLFAAVDGRPLDDGFEAARAALRLSL